MKRHLIALAGLFLMVYLIPLGVRPIMIPDEPRYAEIPREMITTGDWVVPRLNGLRYFEKPVLGYWLNAGSIEFFGENAFAIRIPSALSAGFSSLILFFMVRRFVGRSSPALLTAMVYLTSLIVAVVGTINVLDSLLSLFLTGAMASFFFAHMEDNPMKRKGFLALVGLFSGLAFLTKGFLAFAVPVVVFVPFVVWEGRWKELLRVCWIPLITAVLVSLPWAVMIHLQEPDFWRFFVLNEHIKRFMVEDAQHKESLWYFFFVLPGAALPWTFLLPSAIVGLKRAGFNTPLIRFALCWFIFPFLFFSLSSGKLPTYILPCFPPLAILTAAGLYGYLEWERKRAFTLGVLMLILVIGTVALALAGIQITGFHGFRPYTRASKWMLATASLLFWGLCSLFSARERGPFRKIVLYAVGPVLFLSTLSWVMPAPTIESQAPGAFLLRNSRRIRPDAILVSDEHPVQAVCWFYRRRDVYLLGSPGELSYGLDYDDSRHRLLDLEQFKALVHENHGTGRVTLIAKARKYEKWKHDLPAPVFEASSGNRGFVFVQF